MVCELGLPRNARGMLVVCAVVMIGGCSSSSPSSRDGGGTATEKTESGTAPDTGSSAGQKPWAYVLGTGSSVSIAGIAAQDGDDLQIAGDFENSFVFGPGQPGEKTLQSSLKNEVFTARLSASGALKWATSLGCGVEASAVWPSGPLNGLGDILVVTRVPAGARTYDYVGGETYTTNDKGQLWAYYATDGQPVRMFGTLMTAFSAVAHKGTNNYSLLVASDLDPTGPIRVNPENPVTFVRRLSGKHQDLDNSEDLVKSPRYHLRTAHAFAGAPDGALALAASFRSTDPPPFGLSAGTGDRVCLASLRADDSVAWAKIVAEADQGKVVGIDAAVGRESGPWYVVVAGTGSLPVPAAGGETRFEKGRYVVAYAKDGSALWSRSLPMGFTAAADAPDNSLWILGNLIGEQRIEIAEKGPSLAADGKPVSYFIHYSKEGAPMKVVVVRGAWNPRLAVLSDGSLAIAGEFFDSARIGEGEPWAFTAESPRWPYNAFVARVFP
jgi:hypothetical protein